MFILNANEPDKLVLYLRKNDWLTADETIVNISKPGEGNMNYVLRVDTGERTFIVKQSRGYVEKYPQVAAPENRVVTESIFFRKISADVLTQSFMPTLLGVDEDSNLILLEDLGTSSDFTYLYQLKDAISEDELIQLTRYLNGLHSTFQKERIDDELSNIEMRQLNHEHIFYYPFLEENGFDLNRIQDSLQELALPYKKDNQLKQQISLLGSLYLSNGKYLLHGDYYPGSWLKTSKGIKVIDPEFCYYGSREFDLGVLLAHLYLTKQDKNLHNVVLKNYENYTDLNLEILNGFTGVEIMRRLIGLAQLPLQMDLGTKKDLLAFARTLILK
jgi:5-methylthioribose kinase